MIRMLAFVCALLAAGCAQAPDDQGAAPGPGASPDSEALSPAPGPGGGPFIAGPGSLEGVGDPCGGMQGLQCDQDPASRQYCHYEPAGQCGAADQTGVCRVRPMACPRHYRPVCGCDGRTYANACLANAAGASVAVEGACPPAR